MLWDNRYIAIGVSQDISDRKAAELTLKASHQHVTDILESITDAFFALDTRWRFTYLNQRAEQFFKSVAPISARPEPLVRISRNAGDLVFKTVSSGPVPAQQYSV